MKTVVIAVITTQRDNSLLVELNVVVVVLLMIQWPLEPTSPVVVLLPSANTREKLPMWTQLDFLGRPVSCRWNETCRATAAVSLIGSFGSAVEPVPPETGGASDGKGDIFFDPSGNVL